jgi:signal transduction histidine kinase
LHANLNSVNLLVRDNGQGFDLKDEMPEQHRGLRNMAARADAAGGALTVESAPGVGTTVGVELPIRREEGERA